MIDRQNYPPDDGAGPLLREKYLPFGCRKPPDPTVFLRRYRDKLAAITAACPPEIDAPSRRLASLDEAIEAFRHRPSNKNAIVA